MIKGPVFVTTDWCGENSSSCVLGKLVSVASQFPNVRNVAGKSSWCKQSEVTMLPSYQHGGLM